MTLAAGYDMSPDEGKEEYEEVQADLRKQDEEVKRIPKNSRSLWKWVGGSWSHSGKI